MQSKSWTGQGRLKDARKDKQACVIMSISTWTDITDAATVEPVISFHSSIIPPYYHATLWSSAHMRQELCLRESYKSRQMSNIKHTDTVCGNTNDTPDLQMHLLQPNMGKATHVYMLSRFLWWNCFLLTIVFVCVPSAWLMESFKRLFFSTKPWNVQREALLLRRKHTCKHLKRGTDEEDTQTLSLQRLEGTKYYSRVGKHARQLPILPGLDVPGSSPQGSEQSSWQHTFRKD